MSRAVLVLLLVALGLGLYLWLVEMPAEQKRLQVETTTKKLVDFKEDDVQGFTIISSQGEMAVVRDDGRSEEHTSELQSRLHLVCRLLLEKKKQSDMKSYSCTLYPLM